MLTTNTRLVRYAKATNVPFVLLDRITMPINSERPKIVAQMVRRGSIQERTFDKEFWRNAGHEVRFAASWEMVGELAAFRGVKNESESRLQRSIHHIHFRKD